MRKTWMKEQQQNKEDGWRPSLEVAQPLTPYRSPSVFFSITVRLLLGSSIRPWSNPQPAQRTWALSHQISTSDVALAERTNKTRLQGFDKGSCFRCRWKRQWCHHHQHRRTASGFPSRRRLPQPKMSGYWISFLVLYVVKSSSVAADLVLFSVLRYYYLRKCIAAPARFQRCLVIPPLKRSVCHAGKKMFSDTTRK